MFFAITTPGLEKLAQQEALEKFPAFECEIVAGGVLIQAPIEHALELNRWLKIPTRILFRLFHTRARDLPKLYKKIKAFDWRPYYVQAPTEIHVASQSSRLFDDRKIAKATSEGVADFFKAVQAKKTDIERLQGKSAAALYLRFDHDDLTVSIDTSGERLDRRGVRTWIGDAPLRESYAQACLRALLNQYPAPIDLCDPMSGSGVFAREALDWHAASDQREFACQNFPRIGPVSATKNMINPFNSVTAVESDQKTFKALEHNAPQAQLIQGDCLAGVALAPGLVFIANPPYGKRLKLDNPQAFLNNLSHRLLTYDPRGVALLVPQEIKFQLKHRILLDFSNGGIPVKLAFFE